MNEQVVRLAMVAQATDPERKRDAGKAGRKNSKNQARYMLNLVCETAGGEVEKFSALELLQAAALVVESRSVAV